MVTEKTSKRTALPRPAALVWFLSVLAIISVVVGLASGLTVLAVKSADGPTDPATVLWMVIPFAGSCCLAGVLWTLAWLCRRDYLQTQITQQMVSVLERLARKTPTGPDHLSEQDKGAAPGAAAPAGQDAILEQLRELNANLLLSEEQRRIKGRHLTEARAQRLAQQLEESLSAGGLIEAEGALDRLFRLVPDFSELPAMRKRLEQARTEAEARDTASVGRQVENFMAAGDFAQAETAAEMLLAKHPDSPKAADLVARVRRERETYVTEQRTQMYQKIEKAAADRHWRSALEAARELLDAYPNSTEADAVRAQLDTITDNARIEEVRRHRDQILDLIGRRRYGEAIIKARDVIERFPQTAAAAELRKQMPRLMELAKSEQDNDK